MFVGLFLAVLSVCPRHSFAEVTFEPPDDCGATYSESFNSYTNFRWYKKPMDLVEKVADSKGWEVYGRVWKGTRMWLAALLGVWIAFQTMKHVGSMTETNGLEFATRIGGMCMKAAFIAILLEESVFRKFIWVPFIEDLPGELAGGDGGGVSGMVDAAQIELDKVKAAGAGVQCLAWVWKISILGITIPWPWVDPGILAHGCIPNMFGWILGLVFPILCFDVLIRKGITLAFCPLFVGAFLFSQSKDFGMKGVNAGLYIIFYTVCMVLLMKLAAQLLAESSGVTGVNESTLGGNSKELACKFRLFGSPKDEDCGEFGGMNSNSLLVAVCIGFYCIYMMTQAEKFAEYFSGASLGGNDMMFKAAGATIQAGQTGAGMVAGAAMKGAGFLGKKANNFMDRRAARIVEKSRQGGTPKVGGRFNILPGGFMSGSRLLTGMAKRRLKNRGILNEDGSETEAYGNMLKSGKLRSAINDLSGGTLRKNKLYENWKANGGERNEQQAANADADFRTRRRDANALKNQINWVNNKANQATEWVGDKKDQAKEWVNDKKDQAKDWASDKAGQAKDWIKDKLGGGGEA